MEKARKLGRRERGRIESREEGIRRGKEKERDSFQTIHLETTRNVDVFPLKLVRNPTIQLVDQTTHSA